MNNIVYTQIKLWWKKSKANCAVALLLWMGISQTVFGSLTNNNKNQHAHAHSTLHEIVSPNEKSYLFVNYDIFILSGDLWKNAKDIGSLNYLFTV